MVNKQDNTSGTITITAPDPITDDEILVFVSDGKEKTVMSAISFCIVILDNIQDNTVKVGGGRRKSEPGNHVEHGNKSSAQK